MKGGFKEMRDRRTTVSRLLLGFVSLLLWCCAAATTHLAVCVSADERELRPANDLNSIFGGEPQKVRCDC